MVWRPLTVRNVVYISNVNQEKVRTMASVWILIIFCILIVIFFITFPIAETQTIKDTYAKINIGDVWIDKVNGTNPFNVQRVTIVEKKMGTDGKTPWVMYKRTSGYTTIMKLSDFIRLYTPDMNSNT